MKLLLKLSVFTVAMSIVFSFSAYSKNVKVTPLGSHDGEFCSRDRAMLFEDPDGTKILFDVGRTVAGPDDYRMMQEVLQRRFREIRGTSSHKMEFPELLLLDGGNNIKGLRQS